jgi:hypothetical protein
VILTASTWIAIVISLVLLALLLLPIRILLSGLADDQKGLGYQLVIDWAFGIFTIQAVNGKPISLFFLGLRMWPFLSRAGKKEKVKKKAKKKKYSARALFGWTTNNLQRINVILKRFACAIFLKGYLIGRIGLPDPADTANIALLCKLIKIPTERFKLAIACVYDDEILNIKASVQATLIISYLGLAAVELILERETRIMLRSLLQTRKKEIVL